MYILPKIFYCKLNLRSTSIDLFYPYLNKSSKYRCRPTLQLTKCPITKLAKVDFDWNFFFQITVYQVNDFKASFQEEGIKCQESRHEGCIWQETPKNPHHRSFSSAKDSPPASRSEIPSQVRREEAKVCCAILCLSYWAWISKNAFYCITHISTPLITLVIGWVINMACK